MGRTKGGEPARTDPGGSARLDRGGRFPGQSEDGGVRLSLRDDDQEIVSRELVVGPRACESEREEPGPKHESTPTAARC